MTWNKVLLVDHSLVWYHNWLLSSHSQAILCEACKKCWKTFFNPFQECRNLLDRMEAPHHFLPLSFCYHSGKSRTRERRHKSSDRRQLCGGLKSTPVLFYSCKDREPASPQLIHHRDEKDGRMLPPRSPAKSLTNTNDDSAVRQHELNR